MAGFSNLLPLIILFGVVGALAFVGYGIYTWSQEMSERASKKMEKKNMSFTKDGGLRVGVKEMRHEDYADKTQRAFVKTWNASYDSPSTSRPSGSRSTSAASSRPADSRTTSAASVSTRPSESRTTSTASNIASPAAEARSRGANAVPGSF